MQNMPHNTECAQAFPRTDLEDIVTNIRLKSPELTPEKTKALRRLDSLATRRDTNTDIRGALEVKDAVGVFVGIKPASIQQMSEMTDDPATGIEIQAIYQKLGLVTYDLEADTLFLLSRSENEELLYVLAHELNARHTGDHDKAQRAVGMLLGYPQTATEYFLKRKKSINTKNELPKVTNERVDNFVQMILSPDTFEQELEDYVEPLKAATRQFAPVSYEKICNYRDQVEDMRVQERTQKKGGWLLKLLRR